MAPEVLTRRVRVGLVVCSLMLASGCGGAGGDNIAVEWAIEPAVPVAGAETVARISLQDERGRPVEGARLRLEAHMSHPGMVPVTSTVAERSGGVYEARLQFSMAGDWVLVVTGQLPDGSLLSRHVDVAGVTPAG